MSDAQDAWPTDFFDETEIFEIAAEDISSDHLLPTPDGNGWAQVVDTDYTLIAPDDDSPLLAAGRSITLANGDVIELPPHATTQAVGFEAVG